MQNSILQLTAVLCGKCVLNWVVLLVQRCHMMQTLLGFLCISLALVDSLLALIFSAICILQDARVLGVRVTTHHICLLVQTMCFMYSVLHWPLFLLMGLDCYWNISLHPRPLLWLQKLGYTLGVCFIWLAALLYVALDSGFYPRFDNESFLLLYKCWVLCSPESSQISVLIIMTLACALIYGCPATLMPAAMAKGMSVTGLSMSVGPLSSRHVTWVTLRSFLSTWAPYVGLQVVLLLLHVDVPTYLDLNVPWLCFLNSFWMCVVLWSRSQTLNQEKQLTFTDGFCRWEFCAGLTDGGDGSSNYTVEGEDC